MHDFVICSFFAVRASLMISINILTSLRLFVEKNFLRSRRACASTKSQKSKNVQHVYTIDKKYENMRQNERFCDLHIFAARSSLMISRKFLTSLRLFVEKKYLRSRRAGLAWTKIQKSKKRPIYAWNLTQTL